MTTTEFERMDQIKATILFVDDEENILRGLKRMARPMRKEWNTLLANSGSEALNLLDEQRVDVVVTDMRMPGMDGAELLNHVQDRFPETIRIVLSGFAEKESILKTVGPSHQYLAKPCDQDTLIETIQRSLTLRKLINDNELRQVVGRMRHIPSVPKVFQEIISEIENEYSSADSLADVVSQDVSLTTHLMKLTNSAYFGLPIPARTPKQAITFLGFENVKAVVLLGGVFDQLTENDSLLGVLEILSQRSVQLGTLSKCIAKVIGLTPEEQELAFCAGLVGHLGTLLLVSNWPEKFQKAVAQIQTGGKSISEAEMETFGATHGALGAYLLGLWGFNDSIVEAVAYHHSPGECKNTSPSVLTAMHVAQHLLRTKRRADLEETLTDQSLDLDYMSNLGKKLEPEDWQSAYETVSKEWLDDQ
jgi:HD-like signal output (HDOD) protein/CheY-like chemotaxis protein